MKTKSPVWGNVHPKMRWLIIMINHQLMNQSINRWYEPDLFVPLLLFSLKKLPVMTFMINAQSHVGDIFHTKSNHYLQISYSVILYDLWSAIMWSAILWSYMIFDHLIRSSENTCPAGITSAYQMICDLIFSWYVIHQMIIIPAGMRSTMYRFHPSRQSSLTCSKVTHC